MNGHVGFTFVAQSHSFCGNIYFLTFLSRVGTPFQMYLAFEDELKRRMSVYSQKYLHKTMNYFNV